MACITSSSGIAALRKQAHEAVAGSIPPAVWRANGAALETLLEALARHPSQHHDVWRLTPTACPASWQLRFLGDYGALMEAVTDSVTRSLNLVAQLGPQMGNAGVYGARFLILINLLGELGYSIGDNGLKGEPAHAHALLYADALRRADLGMPMSSSAPGILPVPGAECDYAQHVAWLVVFEQIFLRRLAHFAVQVAAAAGIDTENGYFTLGFTVADAADAHCLLRQCMTGRLADLEMFMQRCLDQWLIWLDDLAAEAVPRE